MSAAAAPATTGTSGAELEAAAQRFCDAWGSGDEGALRGLLANGAEFRPDGVVFGQGARGPDAIVESMRAAHARYRHARYEAVASAANAAGAAAFVAVAWEYEPKAEGGGAGGGGGGEPSRGLALKEFLFDGAGRVTVTRVARQMTAEEKQALLTDPSSCRSADLWGELLPALEARGAGDGGGSSAGGAASGGGEAPPADLANTMHKAIETFDAAWSSGGPEALELAGACAPGLRVLDGYGLHGSGPSYGLGEAVRLVGALRRDAYSSTSLVHWAVDAARGVGFSRWEGKAVQRTDADHQVRLGGLDLALFDAKGRIEALAQFTMRPYPQLRAVAEAHAGARSGGGG